MLSSSAIFDAEEMHLEYFAISEFRLSSIYRYTYQPF